MALAAFFWVDLAKKTRQNNSSMGRPKAQYPTPQKRCRDGSWRINWSWRGTVYEAAIGKMPEREAEAVRLETAAALVSGENFPAEIAGAPAVKRWLADGNPAEASGAAALIAEYRAARAARVSTDHAAECASRAKKYLAWLEARGQGPGAAGAREAEEFLGELRAQGASAAKHNHYLNSGKLFYDWLVRRGEARGNPFAGAKRLKIKKRRRIWTLTRAERDAVLAAAAERPDGVAVWIGCYSGLRRGEIHRLRKEDLFFDRGKLRVWETKNREQGTVDREAEEPRWVDLSRTLETVLRRRVKRLRAHDAVVPWPWRAGVANWQHEARGLLEFLRGACPEITPKKIGFNSFRHTYGTALALPADYRPKGRQGQPPPGAGVDYICAQLGNTSAVARQYYVDLCGREASGPGREL